jgi:hypothetical protein
VSAGRDPDRLARSDPRAWLVGALALVFLALGALFMAAPEPAAALFGIAAPEATGRAYVRAIGFRDLALGLYLAGLLVWSNRPAVRVVIGASLVIPLCDLVLVGATSGTEAAWQLALHAVSGLVLVATWLWLGRP